MWGRRGLSFQVVGTESHRSRGQKERECLRDSQPSVQAPSYTDAQRDKAFVSRTHVHIPALGWWYKDSVVAATCFPCSGHHQIARPTSFYLPFFPFRPHTSSSPSYHPPVCRTVKGTGHAFRCHCQPKLGGCCTVSAQLTSVALKLLNNKAI